MLSRLIHRIAVVAVKPWLPGAMWLWLRRRYPSRKKRSRASTHWRRIRRMNLTELAVHFGTDKWGSHRYTPHYERHFAPFKSETFTLLEIGIGGWGSQRSGGSSLRMWKAFFSRAEIIGLDIEDKSWLDRNRIRTYQGNQTDAALLGRIAEEATVLRVVIDDGSHRPAEVRATFEILFPLLADGGLYAIEDTQTSYWPEWGGSDWLGDPTTTMALVKSLVDGINYEHSSTKVTSRRTQI